MRRYLLFILCICTSHIMAQDVSADYQAFRKGLLSDYQGFRKGVLDDYAKYLQDVWDRYDEFQGTKRDKRPKPSTIPFAEDKPNSPKPLPNPTVVPQELPTSPAVTPKPIKPTIPSATTDFSFYGMTVKANVCKAIVLNDIDHNAIAKAWETYSKESEMDAVVQNLQTLSVAYGLNDWFTFELVRAYSRKTASSNISNVLLQHYLLANMGYDVRLASTDSQLLLLVPFKQQVYERNYIMIDGKKYYAFYEQDASRSTQPQGIYTCKLPQDVEKGHHLDLTFHKGVLAIKSGVKHEFSVSDGTLSLHGSIDKGTMEAIRHYPQMDVPYYAMSCIDSEFHQSLLDQMRMQINGCAEKTAVGKILHFVQYAFKYATDGEQHGYEKPYFIEENFYYPKNDCEDRAVLFAFLVHNLLGLDVHLLHYPGHECSAVNFSQSSVYGDHYAIDGRNYYICDPTYIGASIGQCMPDYRNVKPIVERWY